MLDLREDMLNTLEENNVN